MKLFIPEAIGKQLFCYVQEATPYEITGIGTICFDSTRQYFEVTGIFLPEQEIGLANCNFTPNALHKIIFDLIEDNPARAGDLRFRWHSHGNGKVFWSSIDERDIENTDSDWVVNLVVNSQYEMLARLDLFQPFRIANYPLEIEKRIAFDSELIAKCRAEIAKKTRKKKIEQPNSMQKERWDLHAAELFGPEQDF